MQNEFARGIVSVIFTIYMVGICLGLAAYFIQGKYTFFKYGYMLLINGIITKDDSKVVIALRLFSGIIGTILTLIMAIVAPVALLR